jgi:hypothetical protein
MIALVPWYADNIDSWLRQQNPILVFLGFLIVGLLLLSSVAWLGYLQGNEKSIK